MSTAQITTLTTETLPVDNDHVFIEIENVDNLTGFRSKNLTITQIHDTLATIPEETLIVADDDIIVLKNPGVGLKTAKRINFSNFKALNSFNADEATHATSSNYASSATNATNSTNATNAVNATYAVSSGNLVKEIANINYTLENYYTTVNVTTDELSSPEITIPAGLAIGRKITIRRIGTYDTSNIKKVSIIFSGSELLYDAYSTLPIFGNGGVWTIEKITSTRWEIVDGRDYGVNTYGDWERISTKQECYYWDTTTRLNGYTHTFPIAFSSRPTGLSLTIDNNSSDGYSFLQPYNVTTTTFQQNSRDNSGNPILLRINYIAVGPWL